MEKQTFYYSTASGKSGVSTLRLKPVRSEESDTVLALQLEQLTSGPTHEIVVEGENGAKVTTARILRSGGLWPKDDFRYAVIYEGEKPQSYAVFYVSQTGQITWIAGPKSVSFDKAWREFQAGLQ
jgi:hypothetical protein